MSLILPNSVFIHIPKTGGVSVRYILKELGITGRTIRSRSADESTEGIRSWHCVPTWDEEYQNSFVKFCFVRHPLTWYQSYWAFRMWKKDWQPNHPLDSLCMSDDFIEFIDGVIKYFPGGYVSQLYEYYTQHCSFVGKTEFLYRDLSIALCAAGESFERDELLECYDVRKNETPGIFKRSAMYGAGQMHQIVGLEYDAIRKYGYDK